MLLFKKTLLLLSLFGNMLAQADAPSAAQGNQTFGQWRVVRGLLDETEILNDAARDCEKRKALCKTLYLRGELPITGIPAFDESLHDGAFFYELLYVTVMDYRDAPPGIDYWKNCNLYPRPYPDSKNFNVCIHITDDELMQIIFGQTLTYPARQDRQP